MRSAQLGQSFSDNTTDGSATASHEPRYTTNTTSTMIATTLDGAWWDGVMGRVDVSVTQVRTAKPRVTVRACEPIASRVYCILQSTRNPRVSTPPPHTHHPPRATYLSGVIACGMVRFSDRGNEHPRANTLRTPLAPLPLNTREEGWEGESRGGVVVGEARWETE